MSNTNETNTTVVEKPTLNLKFTLKNISVDKLYGNPRNWRFKGGQVVEGVHVTDTYNSSIMKDVIRKLGGIPGRMVVIEMPDGRYKVICGNRRLQAVIELLADGSTSADLMAALKSLPCNVYKAEDVSERDERELANDQKDQKFRRSEIVAAIFRLQAAGYKFPDLLDEMFAQLCAYVPKGALVEAEVARLTSPEERKARMVAGLKSTIELIVMRCGRLGQRTRKALLLTEMAIDGISPVIGQDKDGKAIYEQPEFKPTQGRCSALYKESQKPDWTAENGSESFNKLIEQYSREDRGIKEDGTKVEEGAKRATSTDLTDMKGRTKSKAAKAALDFANGVKDKNYPDFDDEAYRLEQLTAAAIKGKADVKNETVTELLNIWLMGTGDDLTKFLAKHS